MVLGTSEKVVVKFTQPRTCVPCRQFAPVYETVASKFDDDEYTFLSVDLDKAPWAVADYDLRGVPTVVLFENGKRVRDLKERTAIKFMSELA